MNTTDKKISEVLAKFGEPMAGNVWRVQGTAVIYHKTLERIAAQAKVVFDEPKIIRAERDEAVIQVTGHMGDRVEWSIGEALIGVNYRVSGKQAAYVYAMAEKRAKDRVILKLIELHGYVYSEEEADEFKQGRPGYADPHVELEKTEPQKGKVEVTATEGKIEDDLKAKIKKAKTINAVTDLMLHADTQKILADLPEGIRDEIRDFAKARLVELGWPTKKAA
ncbi:trna delta -isopentenylpyrophosphate transferase [Microvirga sp. VF16]|uniref:trna delta -isopentenylpyrophosphate transferase n=1 Tax=Microvirga sp. VF16 TaxID=2807101 RepID=UPI00193E74EE|nr:trna delta -isopentenylpyrophosphate transferase [Microvirga sp. VF16]QRM28779.1 trna delta -isopentenylpyrophosphate transferase [Microvirga sp. VF16]